MSPRAEPEVVGIYSLQQIACLARRMKYENEEMVL